MNTKYFDHTILKADAKKEDVIKICEEAKKYDFASVCVNGYWTKLVSETLKGCNHSLTPDIGMKLTLSTLLTT